MRVRSPPPARTTVTGGVQRAIQAEAGGLRGAAHPEVGRVPECRRRDEGLESGRPDEVRSLNRCSSRGVTHDSVRIAGSTARSVSMTAQVAIATRWGEPDRTEKRRALPDVDDLRAELRRVVFDMRRAVFVAYLVETGTNRPAAYELRDAAARAGWEASLFGDSTGWVVRITHTRVPRHDALRREFEVVDRLLRAHGGVLRGICVEDLHRESLWDALAAEVVRRPEPRPAPHPPVAARTRRLSRSAGRPVSRSA